MSRYGSKPLPRARDIQTPLLRRPLNSETNPLWSNSMFFDIIRDPDYGLLTVRGHLVLSTDSSPE